MKGRDLEYRLFECSTNELDREGNSVHAGKSRVEG